jgi:hypothetical protein
MYVNMFIVGNIRVLRSIMFFVSCKLNGPDLVSVSLRNYFDVYVFIDFKKCVSQHKKERDLIKLKRMKTAQNCDVFTGYSDTNLLHVRVSATSN